MWLTSPGQVGVQRVAQVNAAFALHHKGGGEVGDLSLTENRSNILADEGHRAVQRNFAYLHVTFQRVERAAVVHDVVINQQQQHLETQTASQDRFTAFTPSIHSSSSCTFATSTVMPTPSLMLSHDSEAPLAALNLQSPVQTGEEEFLMSSSVSCVSVTQDMFVFEFLESSQVGGG